MPSHPITKARVHYEAKIYLQIKKTNLSSELGPRERFYAEPLEDVVGQRDLRHLREARS